MGKEELMSLNFNEKDILEVFSTCSSIQDSEDKNLIDLIEKKQISKREIETGTLGKVLVKRKFSDFLESSEGEKEKESGRKIVSFGESKRKFSDKSQRTRFLSE